MLSSLCKINFRCSLIFPIRCHRQKSQQVFSFLIPLTLFFIHLKYHLPVAFTVRVGNILAVLNKREAFFFHFLLVRPLFRRDFCAVQIAGAWLEAEDPLVFQSSRYSSLNSPQESETQEMIYPDFCSVKLYFPCASSPAALALAFRITIFHSAG